MIRAKLYIGTIERGVLYGKGHGVYYRPFLVTIDQSTEFKRLVNACEKPIYAITVSERCYWSASFYKFMKTINRNYPGEKAVLIPVDLGGYNVPVMRDVSESDLRWFKTKILAEKALVYSKGNYEGDIDPELVDNPLGFLEHYTLKMKGGMIAGAHEISSALWKIRNNIQVVTLGFLEKKQNTEQIKEIVYGRD